MTVVGAKYRLKQVAAGCLYRAGVLAQLQRRRLRQRAVVLTYHRVLTPAERERSASHEAMVVDRQVFAQQMALLRRRFKVLSLGEFTRHLERREAFPDSSCLITFDDGWRDTFHNAYPILKALRLPAVVFLPVGYIGGRRVFWQEALTHLLTLAIARARTDRSLRERVGAILRPAGMDRLLDTMPGDQRADVSAAVASRKKSPASGTESLVEALARELRVNTEEFSRIDGFLNWEQVREMAEGGIEFGGHGMEHRLLTKVTDEEVRVEVETSRDTIGRALGRHVDAFCYPNGYVTPAVAERVRGAGYKVAFTTNRRPVQRGDEPLLVGRLNVHDGVTRTDAMFLARILGVI